VDSYRDPAWARAWMTCYALTYRHDPRPLMLSWAGHNRFEVERDESEIPHMANLIYKADAAYEASRGLPLRERARMLLTAECAAFSERYPEAREHQRALRKYLRDVKKAERVTQAAFVKWYATEAAQHR